MHRAIPSVRDGTTRLHEYIGALSRAVHAWGAWYSAISNRYSWQHTTATYSFAQIPCVYLCSYICGSSRHTCLCANILGKLAVLYCIVQVDQRLLSLLPFTNFSSAPPANTLMCMQPSPSLIFGPRYAPIYLLHECYQLLTLPVRFQTVHIFCCSVTFISCTTRYTDCSHQCSHIVDAIVLAMSHQPCTAF